MSKKICKILTRCCCVAAACCLILAGAAGPLTAYAAEGETKTLSGTWRFNDVLTAPSEWLQENINFVCDGNSYESFVREYDETLGFFFGYGSDVVAYVTGENMIDFLNTSYGLSVFEGWQSEAYKTITIPTDSEVSAEFYAWFTTNAMQVNIPTRSFLDNLSAVGTGIWSGVSGVANTIASNPLLLLTTGFLFLGGCIGILGRFLSRS